jgi:hypothetical protein
MLIDRFQAARYDEGLEEYDSPVLMRLDRTVYVFVPMIIIVGFDFKIKWQKKIRGRTPGGIRPLV